MPHKPRHIHKLVRYLPQGKIAGYRNYRWKCIEKDCFAVFTLDAVKDKEFVCSEPGCENTHIMSYRNYRVARPKCINHDNTKKGKQARETLGLFEELVKTQ